jgi:hypothetical protein
MTISVAIIVCFVIGILSLRAGYRKGREDAVGQIRQFLAIKIGEIRMSKRGIKPDHGERNSTS